MTHLKPLWRVTTSSSHQWDWKCLRKIKICHICTGYPSYINHHITSVKSWLHYVNYKRPVMPPHQTTKCHKGWMWGIATLKPVAMVSTTCGFWRTQQVCCQHLTNLMSGQLHQSRHLIFQHFTPQSHMIYWNLENHNAFRKKDVTVRYTHIKVTRAKGYFTHDINGGRDGIYTADNICKIIEFLIDNIFVQFGWRLFRQMIGIPMGTNCAPLLADLFLYSYENEFLDNIIRSGHRRLARLFNLCYRYIDDLIVFNNKKFFGLSQRDIFIPAHCWEYVTMEYIKSNKDGFKLLYDNYMYMKQKVF